MDEDLRRLERGALVGDEADEARALVARLRGGELTSPRVQLAAYLGHAGARLALGADAPDSPLGDRPDADDHQALFRAVACMGRFGREACVRAAVAVADVVASETGLLELEDVLDLTRAWLVCPCERHERLVGDAVRPSWGLSLGEDGRRAAVVLAARAVSDESPAAQASAAG